MSDRDLIVQFLEKAEKRARSNKRFNDIAVTLAIAFVVPVVFKLLDLIFLFRGRTVVGFLGLWAIATVVWIALRVRGKSPLHQVAGSIDRTAQLHDQLKTAYWFIQNPRDSAWVDAQIHRTAQEAGKLRIDTIYPRRFPRASYMVGGLVFLLVALNFVPLSLNYNWLYLQAAPPFRLSDSARASLEKALKLLEKAKATENAQIAEKIENVITDLEQGNIGENDAIKQLEQLQQELEAGELDAENITNGIGQMAAILRQALPLQPAAQQMAKGELGEAASQMEAVGGRLDSLSAADMKDMSERLQQASERPRGGLQGLANAFATTSAALQRGDRAAERAGLDRIAKELQSLADQLADQALRSEAGDELGDLVDALNGDEQAAASASTQGGKSNSSQNKGGQSGAGGQGETGEVGQQGEAGANNQEQSSAQDGQAGEGDQAQDAQPGDSAGGAPENGPNGKGGNSYGGSTKSAPLEGEATSLEVQLQKEALKIEEEGGGKEPSKDIEAAGERERSKLDYRNAPSDLTPAQKDLLSQDRIPWESRQLIKNYFQAVKPTQTK